jgi:hypothetical protein
LHGLRAGLLQRLREDEKRLLTVAAVSPAATAAMRGGRGQ